MHCIGFYVKQIAANIASEMEDKHKHFLSVFNVTDRIRPHAWKANLYLFVGLMSSICMSLV